MQRSSTWTGSSPTRVFESTPSGWRTYASRSEDLKSDECTPLRPCAAFGYRLPLKLHRYSEATQTHRTNVRTAFTTLYATFLTICYKENCTVLYCEDPQCSAFIRLPIQRHVNRNTVKSNGICLIAFPFYVNIQTVFESPLFPGQRGWGDPTLFFSNTRHYWHCLGDGPNGPPRF